VALLQHDSYYKDQSHLSPEERAQVNYDHPDSLDNDLLYHHLQELHLGRAICSPHYNFKTHSRSSETVYILPYPIIVVEGILVFYDARIREMMGLKVFVDTDADLRFIRRLRRDVAERGRSVDSVIEQYLSTVRLMHEEFVEPTKRFADLIIPEGGYNMPTLLERLVTLLREFDPAKLRELAQRNQKQIIL
jgi:uridine kinase